ncbi:MAG: PIN domain-containing protein [Thermoleophilia bacterium]
MDGEHVFLDACVLVPPRLRGVLFDLSLAGRIMLHWSELVLDEFQRTLLEDGVEHASVVSLRALMEGHWPEACERDWEHLVGEMDNHPKDRHVLAAAVHAEVLTIVTLNLRDFPAEVCARWDVRIQHPDELLCQLFREDPESTLAGLETFANRNRRPPLSVDDVLTSLHWPRRSEFRDLAKAWLQRTDPRAG